MMNLRHRCIGIHRGSRRSKGKSLTPDPSFPSKARLPVAFPVERGETK